MSEQYKDYYNSDHYKRKLEDKEVDKFIETEIAKNECEDEL